MTLRHKPLDQIDEADLQALIENQTPEGKEIEYKEQLPRPGENMEFLADVSSFANCVGGDIFYGISDKRDPQGKPTGVPGEIIGVGVQNLEPEILRLENLARDGIDPRIIGLSRHHIPISKPTPVLVIRVLRSWASPHMVKGSSKFYSRNSAGKYPLDVGEIRAAFLREHAVGERVRNFRLERLALISSDQGPVLLEGAAKIVLHIVPLQAFDPGVQFDVIRLAAYLNKLQPMYSAAWSYLINFDGVLGCATSAQSSNAHSYLQVFRNGIIEAVETLMLIPRNNKRLIPRGSFEIKILDSARRFLGLQQEIGVDPPLLLMLTLLGVRGYEMGLGEEFPEREGHPIDRDDLVISDVLIKDYSCNVAAVLKPCFDAIWNAAGFPRSMN